MKDIAKRCGVSSATVSYVLNDVQNQSIAQKPRSGYRMCKNMVGYCIQCQRKSSWLPEKPTSLAFMFPHTGNSKHKRLLQALAEEAEKAGYIWFCSQGKYCVSE